MDGEDENHRRPNQKHVVPRLCAAPEEDSFSKSHSLLSSWPVLSLLWWSSTWYVITSIKEVFPALFGLVCRATERCPCVLEQHLNDYQYSVQGEYMSNMAFLRLTGSQDPWGSLAFPSFPWVVPQDRVAGWGTGECEHSLLHILLCRKSQWQRTTAIWFRPSGSTRQAWVHSGCSSFLKPCFAKQPC